ncbi:MAG: aldo/keto reductase [Acidobacteriales bacterium]|nr:aldo/keto reductase [Terriglobales bacterium]
MTFLLSRREAIKLTAGAAFGSFAAPMHASSSSMLQRTIPSSGEKIPAVGLGTYQAFDIPGSSSDMSSAKESLRLFVEHGGKVVDSSPMYGEAEERIGDLSADLKLGSQLFIATKVWTSGKDSGIRQMNDSLRKLRTGRIDLMQVHNLLDAENHLATLRDWKKAGKIRYLGVTHYQQGAYDALQSAIARGGLDFVQFNYSVGESEADKSILPFAADHGVAVIANRPFAGGGLFRRVRGKPLPEWAKEFDCTTWAQFFLKYILSHEGVTCAIPATRNPQHLADNMRAGVGRLPDRTQRAKMLAYVRELS